MKKLISFIVLFAFLTSSNNWAFSYYLRPSAANETGSLPDFSVSLEQEKLDKLFQLMKSLMNIANRNIEKEAKIRAMEKEIRKQRFNNEQIKSDLLDDFIEKLWIEVAQTIIKTKERSDNLNKLLDTTENILWIIKKFYPQNTNAYLKLIEIKKLKAKINNNISYYYDVIELWQHLLSIVEPKDKKAYEKDYNECIEEYKKLAKANYKKCDIKMAKLVFLGYIHNQLINIECIKEWDRGFYWRNFILKRIKISDFPEHFPAIDYQEKNRIEKCLNKYGDITDEGGNIINETNLKELNPNESKFIDGIPDFKNTIEEILKELDLDRRDNLKIDWYCYISNQGDPYYVIYERESKICIEGYFYLLFEKVKTNKPADRGGKKYKGYLFLRPTACKKMEPEVFKDWVKPFRKIKISLDESLIKGLDAIKTDFLSPEINKMLSNCRKGSDFSNILFQPNGPGYVEAMQFLDPVNFPVISESKRNGKTEQVSIFSNSPSLPKRVVASILAAAVVLASIAMIKPIAVVDGTRSASMLPVTAGIFIGLLKTFIEEKRGGQPAMINYLRSTKPKPSLTPARSI